MARSHQIEALVSMAVMQIEAKRSGTGQYCTVMHNMFNSLSLDNNIAASLSDKDYKLKKLLMILRYLKKMNIKDYQGLAGILIDPEDIVLKID